MITISDPLRAFAEKLPLDWQLLPFNAMLSEPVRNGIYKKKEFHGKGTRVVNMGELFGFDFISAQEMKRVELTAVEERKSGLKDGDLLFARRSLVFEGAGKCSLVVNPSELLTFESSIIRARPNRQVAEPRFLFYLFSSPLGRAIIASIATRTAVSGIRGSDLMGVGLPLPPLTTQRRIAGILSAYDELIENNQRRIRILEEMARSLCREWFVHFRYPGHEEVPLVDSPLGPIPQGWEVKQVKDFGKVITGKTPSKSNPAFYGEDNQFVKTPDMHGNMFILDTVDRLSDAGALSQTNKTLPVGSICVSCIGTIGVVSLTTEECQTNQQINSVALNSSEHREYLYFCLQGSKQRLENLGSNGATMGNVNKGKFEAMEIISPPSDLLINYHRLVVPIFSEILRASRLSGNLRQARDLLLPKLLSGQISVQQCSLTSEDLYAANS
ncbi:restriction endonuclease subunit S [Mariprofundus sp. KV]|uniref:restriction endonuclease subunit S n=1 Tax=Mariprofundus sp. KV TaxID=2608715 RepID=UPI0015A4709B|nr:restriction endonuclease subunit S [Mariprofundus sp. KV]NWF36661.1 restriction endonuclease subunit S [Mariprofundus sp. KV]